MMSNPFLTAPILRALRGAGTYSAVKLPEEVTATHEKHSTAASFRSPAREISTSTISQQPNEAKKINLRNQPTQHDTLHSHSQFEKPQKLILPKTALKPVEPVGHDQDRLLSDPDGVGSERRVARMKILKLTREAE
ncbi:hypothetical protein Q3G72_003192 [Acer saccharum]|nr:hypothetical protein Q3G72_003192 [Acer saccharum]